MKEHKLDSPPIDRELTLMLGLSEVKDHLRDHVQEALNQFAH